MARIPAVILQHFIGLSDYERKLAIDKASRELGMTVEQIETEIDNFQSGGFNQTPRFLLKCRVKSRFSRNRRSRRKEARSSSTTPTDTDSDTTPALPERPVRIRRPRPSPVRTARPRSESQRNAQSGSHAPHA